MILSSRPIHCFLLYGLCKKSLRGFLKIASRNERSLRVESHNAEFDADSADQASLQWKTLFACAFGIE